MLAFAETLRVRRTELRVLNLGGGDVDTATPMGSMVFTMMAALTQMELAAKRKGLTDSVAKRRATGNDLGRRRQTCTDFQIRSAPRRIEGGGRSPRSSGPSACRGPLPTGGSGRFPPR